MRFLEKIYFPLFLPAFLICSLSITILLSLNSIYAKQQLIYVLLGVSAFFLVYDFDYTLLLLFWKYLLLVINLLLLVTLIIGREVKGSLRWITIGFFNFQPSEFAKLFLIISLAAFFSLNGSKSFNFKLIAKSFLIFLPITFFVFFQPDLGTSLIFCLIYFIMIIQMKVPKIYFIIAFVFLGLVSNPLWHSLKDFQKDRILVFLNPYKDPLGSGYNVLQSQIAVGSGLFFGKGFGGGTQSRFSFLPEYHTDFIFASFSEEWGFVGVFVLLALFTWLILSILKVLSVTYDKFGFFISLGVLVIVLFQLLINVGMNVGIMPVTGITLPLVSYGGSSVVTTFLGLGLVNSVWNRSKKALFYN